MPQANGKVPMYPGSGLVQPLALEDLRQSLIRQEETIIFALIERSQFPMNAEVYTPGGMQVVDTGPALPADLSFLDFILRDTERLHSLVRRYMAPDEHAFFPGDLPAPLLPPLLGPGVLYPNAINLNHRVRTVYQHSILTKICAPGSDCNTYGSTSVTDIAVLQALSKRIHYGKFIAESKFQGAPEEYTKLILANDTKGLMALLTDAAVEDRVLQRVEMKASLFGSDVTDTGPRPAYKIQPSVIRELYRDYIIPLTKEVEVLYLLQRVAHPSVAVCGLSLDDSNPAYCAAVKHFGATIQSGLLLVSDTSEVFHAIMRNEVCYGVILMEDSACGALRHSFLFDLFRMAKLMISDEINIKMPAATSAPLFIAGAKERHLRFVVVAKVSSPPTGNDKTAVCFGIRHQCGSLRDCLECLHSHNINLLSIQSHLLGEQPMIFVEVVGHSAEPAVQAALTDLQRKATFVALLGSFANREGR